MGGVNVTANSSNRLYLLGSKDLVASDIEDLYTYNGTTYFENGSLYIAGNKMATENFVTTRANISSYTDGSDGYIVINGIMIQFGYFSVTGNTTRICSFITPFATCYSVTGSWDNTTTGGAENWGIDSITNRTFRIINGDGSNRIFHYMAIGTK